MIFNNKLIIILATNIISIISSSNKNVGGKLLKAVQYFHVDSRACVRVGNDVSEFFPVNVGLTQGYVMSPWLFNGWCGSRAKC